MMKIIICLLFSFSAFALLPPTKEDLKKVMDDSKEFEKIQKQLMEPGQCGFFKNLEEDEEFITARKTLQEYATAKEALAGSKKSLDTFDEDPELIRRKKMLDEAEIQIRQIGCDNPQLFRNALRFYESMDGIIEALNKKETGLQLHLIKEETLPYEEAYAHYHDYKKSILNYSSKSLERAKRTIARIEKDPLFKKLKSKYSEKELEDIKNTPEFEPPKQIVINFEGTGGFSPNTAKRLKVLNSYSGVNKTNEARIEIEKYLWKVHDDKNDFGMDTWPGTIHGPITQSITGINNKEHKDFKGHPNTQWLYYKSEDQQDSRNNALNCLEIYLYKYKKKYKKDLPKVVIMGHSSGGYSAMKFANQLAEKKMSLKIDLITIDPVIPYKKAALDGFIRKQNPFAKNRIGDHSDSGIFKIDPKKVNAFNFHQSQDVHGLIPTEDAGDIPIIGDRLKKKGLGYGIHGSKVEGADNKEVSYKSGTMEARKAHGGITYHPAVVQRVKDQLK